MCIILEIAMFVGGIYALATAKVPTIVIGGPKYQVEGPRARIVGALLLFPLPLAFMSGVALGLFFGEEAQVVVPVIEVLIILAFSVAALIVAYASRQPRLTTDSSGEIVEAVSDTEALIARKARGSLVYVILGAFGAAALILLPLAFIRSGQALRLIDEHQIGERYRSTAKVTRALSAIIFLFWAAIALIALAILVAAIGL